jgi:hypothetical protein
MGEASGGTQEARGEEDELSSSRGHGRRGESLLEDGLDAGDLEQLEVQGALAGGIEAAPAVLVAEPEQLLRLAKMGPGKRRDEQAGEEALDVRADAAPLGDQAVGIAHGVGGELLGLVGVVG